MQDEWMNEWVNDGQKDTIRGILSCDMNPYFNKQFMAEMCRRNRRDKLNQAGGDSYEVFMAA